MDRIRTCVCVHCSCLKWAPAVPRQVGLHVPWQNLPMLCRHPTGRSVQLRQIGLSTPPGNPEIWRSGDLEIQKFGVQKIQIIKILKIQIRSAQNVGKVWISSKKILQALFGAI